MNLELEFLYYFSNQTIDIVETKVLNLSEGTPIGQIYHWLWYDHKTQQVYRFDFQSMKSENGVEHRQFKQAKLHFDNTHAHLEFQNQTPAQTMTLKVTPPTSLPPVLIQNIQTFLQQTLDITP